MKSPRKSVAIVGGGASGTLTALHLSKLQNLFSKIVVFEESGNLGQGLAYSTPHECHLLNVPAKGMSALPDDPLHFLKWLKEESLAYNENSFVPRRIYSRYLKSLFPQNEVQCISKKVIRIERNKPFSQSYRIHMASNDSMDFDLLVLAFGNSVSSSSSGSIQRDQSPHFIKNIWKPGALTQINSKSSVLILGSGLSMIDAVLMLKEQGHWGSITALSRRGILPQPHKANPVSFDLSPSVASSFSLRSLIRSLRKQIQNELQAGKDWRPVIDLLRPVSQNLWMQFSNIEKKRFLRHVRPYWDSHRHRMAPEIHEKLIDLIFKKDLRLSSGRVISLTPSNSQLHLLWRPRGEIEERQNTFDFVLDCTGVDADWRKQPPSLLTPLLDEGEAVIDSLGLGLKVNSCGALINKSGLYSQTAFALGSLVKGSLWEVTAIPEIRVQAKSIANALFSTAQ